MFSGMTGKSFHSTTSGVDVDGIKVGIAVPVGKGVMGEYFLGFWVAVGSDADDLLSKSSAAGVCVGPLTGIMPDSAVASPVQAVIKTQAMKVRSNRRFIKAKYSRGKLIGDEILCYTLRMAYQGLLHKYGTLLDLPLYTRRVSLLEGDRKSVV